MARWQRLLGWWRRAGLRWQLVTVIGTAVLIAAAVTLPLARRDRVTKVTASAGGAIASLSTSTTSTSELGVTTTAGSATTATTVASSAVSTTSTTRRPTTTTTVAVTPTTSPISDILPTPVVQDVIFTSVQVGWVKGYVSSPDGTIVARTTDGGRTWRTSCFSGLPGKNTMSFLDDRVGFVIAGGRAPILYVTGDGGATWTAQPTGLTAGQTTGMRFLDRTHGWLFVDNNDGTGPALARTTDGGQSWQLSRLPFAAQSFWFANAAHGVAVGRAGGGGAVATTDDGGRTWTDRRLDQTLPDRPALLYAVAGTADGVVWAVGGSRAENTGELVGSPILRSDDGGATWQVVPAAPPGVFLSLMLVNGQPWTSGGAQVPGDVMTVIETTTDNGATWQQPYRQPSQGTFESLSAAGGSLWAAGLQGGLVHSADGGQSWVSVPRARTRPACP